VCAYTGPVEALELEPQETAEDPPKNVQEFAKLFVADNMETEACRQKDG
jgi:hypothetical protein